MILRLSKEIIYWNHFQIRCFTLEKAAGIKVLTQLVINVNTDCHLHRITSDFSSKVVYTTVAFISVFSSLLALYLPFLIWAFVIYCCEASNLFLHQTVGMWPQAPEDNSVSFSFFHGCILLLSDCFI